MLETFGVPKQLTNLMQNTYLETILVCTQICVMKFQEIIFLI